MAELWIYSFRRVGKRELTEAELQELRIRIATLRAMRILWGAVAVVLALSAIGGVILADSRPLGWVVSIVTTIGFFWALSFANRAERLALLFRRSQRMCLLDQYQRAERTDEVRSKYRNEAGREESTVPSIYWAADEEFEQRLLKHAGSPVQSFETPSEDDVLVRIEGRFVNEVIDVPVLQV